MNNKYDYSVVMKLLFGVIHNDQGVHQGGYLQGGSLEIFANVSFRYRRLILGKEAFIVNNN